MVTGTSCSGVSRRLVATAGIIQISDQVRRDDVQGGCPFRGEVDGADILGSTSQLRIGGGDEENLRAANQISLLIGYLIEVSAHLGPLFLSATPSRGSPAR